MNDISELIPQKQPIVMVDGFLGMENEVSRTDLHVREDNLFVTQGRMSECGLIEHIAQSAAARVGYVCGKEQRPVPIGYIASVNDFSFYRLPLTGECIETEVHIVQEVGTLSLIYAISRIGGEVIAECRMKIILEQ